MTAGCYFHVLCVCSSLPSLWPPWQFMRTWRRKGDFCWRGLSYCMAVRFGTATWNHFWILDTKTKCSVDQKTYKLLYLTVNRTYYCVCSSGMAPSWTVGVCPQFYFFYVAGCTFWGYFVFWLSWRKQNRRNGTFKKITFRTVWHAKQNASCIFTSIDRYRWHNARSYRK